MTWDDVLARQDLGDIESQEDGDVFRGPLKSIRREGDLIHFETEWMAVLRLSQGVGDWVFLKDDTPFFVNTSWSIPQDIGDGRIMFQLPFLGFVVIFPKGGSTLDKSIVNEPSPN